jgi:hypothetical protein
MALLELLSPEPDAVLTMADDQDPDAPGLQITIRGQAQGLADGTQIDVFIDDDQQDDRVGIDETGLVTLEGVTLPPGTHALSLRTSTGSLRSEDQQYTFRALVITAPEDGRTLTLVDDEEAGEPGVQISVAVRAYAVDPSEAVTLLVDGEPAGDAQMPQAGGTAGGMAVFSGVTLPPGEHTLGAFVPGEPAIAAEEITVTVSEACAEIDFITPRPPDSGDRVTLGGVGMCPMDTDAPFALTVNVSTDAGDGQRVDLFVNGQPVDSALVRGSSVEFKDVALTNLATTNTLRVEVMNRDGVTCGEDFPADIFIDCAGPDCTLAGPTPVDYVDGKGDLTLYLNAGHRRDGGFDIDVATDRPGQRVSLVVDRDEGSALGAESVDGDEGVGATFEAVKLTEGGHWLQGRCEDEAGNVSLTDEVRWVVDTVACDVEFAAPDVGTLFVPADDDDANPANGTQIVVTSTVDGGDCVAQRAGPCDPATGLMTPDLVPYDGTSPLLSALTLDLDNVEQTLCVEVQDRAQNTGLATLDVRFRGIPPTLEIQSPADGETFNALGNAGHTQDADTGSGACDADFSVACTEVGEPVDLHLVDASGPVFATATCTAPGPAGFPGRAEVSEAFDGADTTAVVVATQVVTADSGEMLTGSSAAITIAGDCVAPSPSFQGDPCQGGFIGIVNMGDPVSKNITVISGSGVTETVVVTLDVSNAPDGPTAPGLVPSSALGTLYTFNNVALGSDGDLTLTAHVVDSFDNASIAMCTATILTDLPPAPMVSAPTDDQSFGPGDGCNAGAGVFGVQVTATVDTDINRQATVSVNGGTPVVVPITGGMNVSACVPVPDDVSQGGPSTIRVTATSTASGGFQYTDRTVHVHTVEITDPTPSQVLVAGDDCGGAGFAYQVLADVDAAHLGAPYTIASGAYSVMGTVSGSQITGCLDLDEGAQVITVSIDGTSYASVNVTVASTTPANEIVLAGACPSMSSTTYRTSDLLHLTWPDEQSYPGQFTEYLLRCALGSIASAASPDAWWTAATPVVLGVTPPATAADIAFRVGETRHCALRAQDAAMQLTPISVASDVDVTCRFREAVLVSPNLASANAGYDAVGVGDVNGDTIDDVLVGGLGRAYLWFGRTGAFPVSPAPDVTFTVPSGFMGSTVSELGDFNGDGENDFAIGWRNWGAPGPARRGQVFVFFGRTSGNDWPAAVDLSVTCGADLCLKHASSESMLGYTVASAGDFNGDGSPDLATGAPKHDGVTAGANTGRLFVVLGKDYEVRSCAGNGDCRATETCVGGPPGTCTMMAGQNFWGLNYELPSGNWLNAPAGTPTTLHGFMMNGVAGTVARFGQSMAALGAFDTTAGDDLVVSAPNCTSIDDPFNCATTTAATAQLHFLSGRTYSGPTGLDLLAFTQVGFRDIGGMPSGMPFETGQPAFFGANLAVSNVLDTVMSDKVDLLTKRLADDKFYVYTGDSNFAPASRVQVNGIGSDYLGDSVGADFHPALPAHPSFPTPERAGDLDGDGVVDLCAGASAPAGATYVWYSDVVDASSSDLTLTSAEGSRVEPAPSAGTLRSVVRFVGDLNGDGAPDLLVGNPDASCVAGSSCGRATLLY